MWTDGSCVDELGVGAVHVFAEGITEPIHADFAPSGYLSGSYRDRDGSYCHRPRPFGVAEGEEQTLREKSNIVTDSQSSISDLKSGPLKNKGKLTSDVWTKLIGLARGGYLSIYILSLRDH